MFIGELISIGVAFSWTITALCMEYASRKLGSNQVNAIRLSLAVIITGLFLLITTGCFLPTGANEKVWLWMSISGLIGYVFGDFCLFYSYIVIGARFGQLFMTLAPIAASTTGILLLDETIKVNALLGIIVTITGIAISIYSKNDSRHLRVKLPLKGILLGIGAGIGQGVGLVCSKYGMSFYYGSTEIDNNLIPFAAGEIRMIIGAAAFITVLLLSGKIKTVKPAFTDWKASLSILGGTIFGPFIGVSFSLLAVQYTASGIASTLMAMTPIMIIPFAIIIQKQKVTWAEILGAIISVTGASLFFI